LKPRNLETVLEVKHFTEDLFWFKTTRNGEWKKNFRPGEFNMIGMPGGESPLRAYSICSLPEDNFLEFLSIKVPDGPLTSKLQHIKVGDELEVTTRAVGTLVLPNLDVYELKHPKPRLWCISTGTGLAPFLSIARHEEAYKYYDQVIVTHTCRRNDELVFRPELESNKAVVWQSVTREEPREGVSTGRVTDKIRSGDLFSELHYEGELDFNIERDRIMICGGPSFNIEIRDMLEAKGWIHGTNRAPGHYCQERAFVESL
tara:strand:- start:5788 stop:6564 length:777 start_codon:yes stop_codon:yes gene_type:complete